MVLTNKRIVLTAENAPEWARKWNLYFGDIVYQVQAAWNKLSGGFIPDDELKNGKIIDYIVMILTSKFPNYTRKYVREELGWGDIMLALECVSEVQAY